MPKTIKKGSKILVVEGPQQGQRGIVSQVRRVFDADSNMTRWTVWANDLDGGERIKTRLNWVREI